MKKTLLYYLMFFPVFAFAQGLDRHDFFYAGEGKIHHMYMVKGGKVVWRFNQWSRNAVFDPEDPLLQAIELTPDKKVVWELCSWHEPANLGPSTIIQLLSEPVVREKMFFGEFR